MFGTILEGLRNFGGGLNHPQTTPPRYATACGHCRTDWPQDEGSDLQNMGNYLSVKMLYLSETSTSGNTNVTISHLTFLQTAFVWVMFHLQHFYMMLSMAIGQSWGFTSHFYFCYIYIETKVQLLSVSPIT